MTATECSNELSMIRLQYTVHVLENTGFSVPTMYHRLDAMVCCVKAPGSACIIGTCVLHSCFLLLTRIFSGETIARLFNKILDRRETSPYVTPRSFQRRHEVPLRDIQQFLCFRDMSPTPALTPVCHPAFVDISASIETCAGFSSEFYLNAMDQFR